MKQLKIDSKLLKKLCHLAKIEIEPNEEQNFLSQLKEIAAMMGTISNVDFPMKDERMIFHQVINQFSTAKKYDCEPNDIINKFPHSKEAQPIVPPILGKKDE